MECVHIHNMQALYSMDDVECVHMNNTQALYSMEYVHIHNIYICMCLSNDIFNIFL